MAIARRHLWPKGAAAGPSRCGWPPRWQVRRIGGWRVARQVVQHLAHLRDLPATPVLRSIPSMKSSITMAIAAPINTAIQARVSLKNV